MAQGGSRTGVGVELMEHLDDEHRLPADPLELAECAISDHREPRVTYESAGSPPATSRRQ